jgi:sec-independent protein translocase protein TatC
MSDKVDDEIEASRAPLLSHLSELRTRLMVALAALIVAFIACLFIQDWLFAQLTNPFVTAIQEAQRAGGQAGAPHDPIRMVNTDAFGFFITKMKVVLFAAIIVSFPIIAWQAYAFIAPGLYKKERGAVLPFLIASPVMFLLGAAFVYYVGMPFALIFAIGQQQTIHGAAGQLIQVEYLPKVDEYVGLLTTLVLAFGLFFQLPVVLSLLARIGVVTSKFLLSTWRYALVGVAAFSALVTPPDILSMTIMTIPLFLVFLLSILLVWLIERGQRQAEPKDVHSPGP